MLSSFCNHLDGEESAGCFTLFVLLVSSDSCVALPHDAPGLSAVCDCGISRSYSLTIFDCILDALKLLVDCFSTSWCIGLVLAIVAYPFLLRV